MKKVSLLFILILLGSNIAFADVYTKPANLTTISKQIPQMGSIKCKFKQTKYLHNISKPLVSGGDFEFVANKGVYFKTNYPVRSETNYTNTNYKEINDIIQAISSKKYYNLEKEFDFYYENLKDCWCLGMKPKKQSGTFNFISNIIVEGSDYIHKIDITQTNGNRTVLWFTK